MWKQIIVTWCDKYCGGTEPCYFLFLMQSGKGWAGSSGASIFSKWRGKRRTSVHRHRGAMYTQLGGCIGRDHWVIGFRKALPLKAGPGARQTWPPLVPTASVHEAGSNTSSQCSSWHDCSNHGLEDHLTCHVWNSPAPSWLCPWSFHSFLLNPWRWVLPPPPSDCCFVNCREEGWLGQPAVKLERKQSRAKELCSWISQGSSADQGDGSGILANQS